MPRGIWRRLALGMTFGLFAASAGAEPVIVDIENRGTCDPLVEVSGFAAHEIGPTEVPFGTGTAPGFDANQSVNMGFADMDPNHWAFLVGCAVDDGHDNDYVVSITNTSPFPYVDLHVIADGGVLLGNADGVFFDPDDATGVPGFALRIDATGLNRNLLGGDADGLFAPGETWDILVANFGPNLPLAPPVGFLPSAGSIGLFAGSSADSPPPADPNAPIPSTLSLIGTQVPEPGSAALLTLGLAALAACRMRAR